MEQLEAAGIEAVAPLLSPHWARSDQGPYAPCSNWSERHAAYAAGLGTFGLCDGLITPVGKAMRTGSVVAAVKIRRVSGPMTIIMPIACILPRTSAGSAFPAARSMR